MELISKITNQKKDQALDGHVQGMTDIHGIAFSEYMNFIFKDLKKICPEIFIPYFSTFICSRETSTQIHMLYFQPSKISQIIYDTSYLIYHSIHILKLSPTEVHSLTHSSHMLFITIHSLFKNFILYFFILYLSCFILQQCYPEAFPIY